MPIVAPQYGITPERKRNREHTDGMSHQEHPSTSPTAAPAGKPQFWYPKDLDIPEDSPTNSTPQRPTSAESKKVTVEVRKRRSIPR
ncbi:MAG: hypothetical protein ACP5D5_04060 [Acidithiobacillus sp.]|uniref:hypothetical protein n=1 Tax=Acidithiobacillus sp. TaxID=1872118 RepID=UPI003CFC532C